jgi:hypothetical protein
MQRMSNLGRHTAATVKFASIFLRVLWKRGKSARCLLFLDATSTSRSRFRASVSANARSIFIVDDGGRWKVDFGSVRGSGSSTGGVEKIWVKVEFK